MNRVLIAGLPRSGTTWVGRVLSRTDHVRYLNEPDNERHAPFALPAKLELGRFPILSIDEEAPTLELLWERAFSEVRGGWAGPITRGSRWVRLRIARKLIQGSTREVRAALSQAGGGELPFKLRTAERVAFAPPVPSCLPENVVVKSVHCLLAMDWIWARWEPTVLVITRHPLNILASWMQLGHGLHRLDEHPLVQERYVRGRGLPPLAGDASPTARRAWQLGLLMYALEEASSRHPEWRVVAHEDLCADPVQAFRDLSSDLGLQWTDHAEAFLVESNRPGEGYATNRVGGEQPERWRKRLTPQQISEASRVLSQFPIQAAQSLSLT